PVGQRGLDWVYLVQKVGGHGGGYERRQALVEILLICDEHRRVHRLVQDGVGEQTYRRWVVVEHARKDWIFEPTPGGERGHAPDIDVPAVAFEPFFELESTRLVEPAESRTAAYDWKSKGERVKRQWMAGVDELNQ